MGLLDALIANAAQEMARFAHLVATGAMRPTLWYREMQNVLAHNWAASYKAGLGRNFTKGEVKWLEREYNKHNVFLQAFRDDIASGNLSEAQIANRASMYADRLRGLYEAGQVAAHDIKLPQVPGDGKTQCFYSAFHVSVLTQEKGFINLPSVKVGMHVLTHKGRFREVLEHIYLPGSAWAMKIFVSYGGKAERSFTVTPDHMFAAIDGDNVQWIRADQLQIGQVLSRIDKHCELPGCENTFDLLVGRDAKKRFCGFTCSNRFDIERRTRHAHEVTRQQAAEGSCALQRWRRDYPELLRGVTQQAGRVSATKHPRTGKTYEELLGPDMATATRKKLAGIRKGKTLEEIHGTETATRMREINRERLLNGQAKTMRAAVKNPSAVKGQTYEDRFGAVRAQEIKAKVSLAAKKQWEDNGEAMRERLAQAREDKGIGLPNGKRTKPERILAGILEELDIPYKEQVWFLGRYCVDFYLPKHSLVLEADGDYWHNYPDGLDEDRERDAKLKNAKGIDILRFWERDLERNALVVKEQVSRITANHAGLFQPIHDVTVTAVEIVHPKEDVECLTVAEDNSFVISGGLISHNCHTNCRCHLEFEDELDDGGGLSAINVTWVYNDDEGLCPDCQDLGNEWNPLRVEVK